MEEGDKFLIADVGGTKALLFLVRYVGGVPEKIKKQKFACADYTSLEEIIIEFLRGEKEIKYAVVGAAGAVNQGKCTLTNLLWTIDEKKLVEKFKMTVAVIVNDIEMLGSGLSCMDKKDLLILQKGKVNIVETKSILSVGTGLGEGIILPDRVLATEGGHCDFAPTTEEEITFLQWMKQKHGHVSYERVLSGEGIQNIYEFFTKKRGLTPEDIFAEGEGNKTISFFLNVLGNEAANLALKTLSLGGVYLSGGVLEKNELLLQREGLIEAFYEKGRFKKMLKGVQVALITGDSGTLFGGQKILLRQIKARKNPK